MPSTMEFDRNRFDVHIARDDEEVAAAQRLRYRVFVEEMGAPAAGADHEMRLEKDRYDKVFDHLILIDRARRPADPLNRVVGVYRLLPSDRAARHGGFYSAGEYDLSPLTGQGRKAVELGRSCVAAEYRGTVAMHLLWSALADYVRLHDIRLLFGVASFHGTDPAPIAHALSHLHYNHLAPDDIRVRALPAAFLPMDILPPGKVDRTSALAQLPALIKAYLRLGGCVGEGAFIDHDFNTIDVCLLMDTERMVGRYKEFYGRGALVG